MKKLNLILSVTALIFSFTSCKKDKITEDKEESSVQPNLTEETGISVQSNFTVMTNGTDHLITKYSSDETEIDFFGQRDQNGVPTVVDQISVNEVYTGDTLISSVTINKMRSKNIRFRATGMRPNAKLFAFFADISIDAWVKGETFATGFESAFNTDPSYGTSEVGATQNPNGISQLESDADGICEGSFFLPTGVFDCGTVKFELRDVSGEGNENWLCRGVTNYTAQGTLQTFQKNYTSTRIIHIEGDQDTYTAPKKDDSPPTGYPPAKTDNDDNKGSSGGGNSTYTGGTCGPKNYSKKNNNSGKGHSSQTIGQMPVSNSFSAPASDYSNTSFGTSSGGSITVAEIDAMNTAIHGPW